MKYLMEHPLRSTLSKKDWKRIQAAIDKKHDNATLDEIEAAHDVFYDAIAAQTQTHYGVTTLQ
jgi:histidine ammonia-lyase